MQSQATLRQARATTTADRTARPAAALRSYRSRVTALAERIRGTEDISAIIEMLNEALAETRQLRSGDDELATARRKVAEAERSIETMRNELEHVKTMLHQDPLTDTLNRRGIDDAFLREASRCDRHGAKLSIALIDLDNFKHLNDTFGHQVGDRALIHVTGIVRNTLRPTDRVGRFGGEEFLILLPDTGINECAAVMNRIKRELASHSLSSDGIAVKVTFSAGLVERLAQESLDQLVARADSALYEAKRAGKNRINLAR